MFMAGRDLQRQAARNTAGDGLGYGRVPSTPGEVTSGHNRRSIQRSRDYRGKPCCAHVCVNSVLTATCDQGGNHLARRGGRPVPHLGR